MARHYSSELRRERLARGQCGVCSRPAVEGLTVCAHHREQRRRQDRKRYHARRSRGLCVGCGTTEKRGDRILCAGCSDARNMRRQEHKRQGLCRECSAPAKEGITLCAVHRKVGLERYARLRAKRKARGLCPRCCAPRQARKDARTYCRRCRQGQRCPEQKRDVAPAHDPKKPRVELLTFQPDSTERRRQAAALEHLRRIGAI